MRKGFQRQGQQGFTLMEIVIVLVLVALMVGGALAYMAVSDDERTLRRSYVEVESLAKRARALAALQQRPYALEFYEQTVSLMPLAEAMVDPRDRENMLAHQENMLAEQAMMAAEEGSAPVSSFNPIHASWTVDDDVKMFVRRWASDNWIPSDTKNRHVWRFDPEGFCEPLGVKFAQERSWVEIEFHPLTGGIRDQVQEIY
ncbi:prepilin-type N-terminal cleavage/methylation domain-containing protein [Luteolibacter flavescens]|uniref:Prepilin-type N-terminal cleavage/methylation domain-containing protein n=1 Tax=Luteolibacter flavescens TaxID=1859460 RepID=A0ABT3FSP2_9BACT|nr:prepilin-type N-terminal cleavage/methylation domain-containing protein [Luteolibacter flavescens]MCW1886462.1 prepilin-type N-terminal cleavage/methylation domain-containing protein [Luteolibacter flavescens]